jgi:hypothetical protein
MAVEYPNFMEMFAHAANAGRQMRQQDDRRNALAMYAKDPDGAENALMASGDVDTANALMQRRVAKQKYEQEQTGIQTRKAVGAKVAAGDRKGAQAVAAQAGDFDLQKSLSEMDDTEFNRNLKGAELTAQLADGIKANSAEGTPERQRMVQSVHANMVHLGLAAPDAQIDSSDAGLDALRSASGKVLQAAAERNKPVSGAPGTVFFDPQTHRPIQGMSVPEKPQFVTAAPGERVYQVNAPATGAPAATGPQGQGADAPQGLRNNNPLNVRPLGDGQWAGQTGTDGGFAVFDSPQSGWNAAHHNLETYATKYGINTIAGVVNRWAPAGDGNNNPQAYAQTVSQAVGIPANQPIDLRNPQVREKVLTAMAAVENGQPVQPPGAGGAQAPAGVRLVAEGAPKATKEVRQLTPQEIGAQGLPKGTVAQIDNTGRIAVISKPSDRISDNSRQTASYAYRMNGANDTMNNLAAQGIVKPTAQILISEQNGVARLIARNPKDAQFAQAAQEWIMAKLRKESGAAIGAQELQNDLHTYFPEPGDSDALVHQKAASRRRTMVGMINQAKDAYDDQYGSVPKGIDSKFPVKGGAPAADPKMAGDGWKIVQ